MRTRGISAGALVFLAAALASAHPMGNFSINRYARIEPSEKEVSLLYIVDFAEIPTFQEIAKIPSLGADLEPRSLNGSPDRVKLAARLTEEWLPGLRISSANGPIKIHARKSSLEFAQGVGGLPTMKLRLELEGAWPRRWIRGTVQYKDSNSPDRIGWREVVVRPGEGVTLAGDFSSADRSRELTGYPIDPAADIPQVVSANVRLSLDQASLGAGSDWPQRSARQSLLDPRPQFAFPRDLGDQPSRTALAPEPLRRLRSDARAPIPRAKALDGPGPGAGRATAATDGGALSARGPRVVAPPPMRSAQTGYVRSASRAARPAVSAGPGATERAAVSRSDRFADLVSRRRLTPGIVLLSLLIAACLGGLHALSPGHGKTVVAAYLVGSRGTAKHALLLGLVVTASHTIGVFLLGIVTLALSKAIVPEKLYPAIQFLSGLTIVAIGVGLFAKRLRRASHDHGHSHAVEVPDGAPTASALLALGVSGGILPCPSALVVLLSAIALHRVGFGLVLIVAFSAGLAAVLSGIGILVVRAGRILSRFESAGAWARRVPAFSALLIGALGLAIAARAFADVQRAFF